MEVKELLDKAEELALSCVSEQAYIISEGLPAGVGEACFDLAKTCITYGVRLLAEKIEELNGTE